MRTALRGSMAGGCRSGHWRGSHGKWRRAGVELCNEVAQGLEVVTILGRDLAAVSPRAGRDLNVEHPPGTLLGLDALATGSSGWRRLHGSKPTSNDGRWSIERENLQQVTRYEPDEPGQRHCNAWLTDCRSLEAADHLHYGRRGDRDGLVCICLIQQMSLQQSAWVDSGDERCVPRNCQGSSRPASIASWSSSADGNASVSLRPARSTAARRSDANAAIRSCRSREETPSSARRTIASLAVVPNSWARRPAASSTE
jgi:hypothetical protein